MFKLFKKEKKKQECNMDYLICVEKSEEYSDSDILKDLQGNNFKFYRGKELYNISDGHFFCNCYDIAKGFSSDYDFINHRDIPSKIYESEICLKNPIVLDVTCEEGHYYYNSLHIEEGKFYPEYIRPQLLEYMEKENMHDSISTDEIAVWARACKIFDGVIIKNVREGINSEIPIYDVIIWDYANLINCHDITDKTSEVEKYRQATFKRVDLSKYLNEPDNQDGIADILHFNDYYIERRIAGNGKFYLENVLVVPNVKNKISVRCTDSDTEIIGLMKESGKYSYSVILGEKELVAENGKVEIQGICPIFKNFIINHIKDTEG